MVKNLKRLRQRRGLSQQALAEAVGISQQSINKYENYGTEPDIALLIALADCFQTSVDYLVGHTDIDHVIEPVSPYDLNGEEIQLVEGYRSLTVPERESIRLVIQNYRRGK